MKSRFLYVPKPVSPDVQVNHVLSIAGFDPSGGAGVLSDIKTIHAHGLYGFGVCSAITIQNDMEFYSVNWLRQAEIIRQIEIVEKRFKISFVKIGLIENLFVLNDIIDYLKNKKRLIKQDHSEVLIIWDPILRSSSGFTIHHNFDLKLLYEICTKIYLITPNKPEAAFLTENSDPDRGAGELSEFCNVYLKGGHGEGPEATDTLFLKGQGGQSEEFVSKRLPPDARKHGSGCVLSSAITANLAKGQPLADACSNAKEYMNKFLESTNTLLGNHTI